MYKSGAKNKLVIITLESRKLMIIIIINMTKIIMVI